MITKRQVIERLDYYSNLQKNWDDEGGIAPTKIAIDTAKSLLSLLPSDAKLPQTCVSGDGEVGFFWSAGNAYAYIGFNSAGLVSYYTKLDNDLKTIVEGAPLTIEGISELIKAVNSFSEIEKTPS